MVESLAVTFGKVSFITYITTISGLVASYFFYYIYPISIFLLLHQLAWIVSIFAAIGMMIWWFREER